MLVDQYRTEDVLRKHLAGQGIHVELGTEPTALDQEAEGVTVTLNKGSAGNEKLRVAYVIGCDGAKGESSSDLLYPAALMWTVQE